MYAIDDLVKMTEDQLSRIGIGELNLACGADLPGAEEIDYFASLGTLADWIDLVRLGTENMWPKYPKYQREFGATEAQFRIWVMVTVLQRNLGVHYDLAQLNDLFDATDSRPRFIHGPLMGFGGSCVSLPILYTAAGRGLGYPLWLVFAKEHVFVRWEGEGGRFNIETTSQGFAPVDDAHYHEHPRPLTAKELAQGIFLRNLSPKEELSLFLNERGQCLLDNLHTGEAAKCFCYADKIASEVGKLHLANWVTASLLHVTLESVRKKANRLQDDELADLIISSIPTPTSEWDRQVTRLVRENVGRILALHKAKGRRMRTPGYLGPRRVVNAVPARWTYYA